MENLFIPAVCQNDVLSSLTVFTLWNVQKVISPAHDARDAYYRFQLGGDLFFCDIHILNVLIDQDLTWTQLVSACHLIFHDIFTWQKNQNFMVLPLARSAKHGAGSVQTE